MPDRISELEKQVAEQQTQIKKLKRDLKKAVSPKGMFSSLAAYIGLSIRDSFDREHKIETQKQKIKELEAELKTFENEDASVSEPSGAGPAEGSKKWNWKPTDFKTMIEGIPTEKERAPSPSSNPSAPHPAPAPERPKTEPTETKPETKPNDAGNGQPDGGPFDDTGPRHGSDGGPVGDDVYNPIDDAEDEDFDDDAVGV